MIRHGYIRIICTAILAVLFSSCFTGIESTPKISHNDVRRRDAAKPTPEQLFLSDINPQPPSDWKRGKAFYIADDKISIIFMPGGGNTDSLAGHDLIFESMQQVPSVTGRGATQILFTVGGRDREFIYQIDAAEEDVLARQRLEVPFTIERSIVAKVDSAMKDNTYYISTPKWFDATNDKAVVGRRHIPVTITRVEPGTFIYPLKVYFTVEGDETEKWIPMTIGTDRAATRNFAALFNFDDLRKRYPQISDENWQLIINSKVAIGMTRDECRLALGSPNSTRPIPVTFAVVEQWSYDDGVYLIFEDGILTRYRI